MSARAERIAAQGDFVRVESPDSAFHGWLGRVEGLEGSRGLLNVRVAVPGEDSVLFSHHELQVLRRAS